MQLPQVTIAIPCLDEEAFIQRCVRDALQQDYPEDRLEVWLADGGSTDRTREILDALGAQDARVRWLDNPGRMQARGMNEILRVARGEVIVRFDAHCEYAPDYVRRCVEVMQRTGADNVGGAQRAKASTDFQRALCAALDSVLGVGGAAYRSAEREGFVDTVFCGAFRRQVFEKVGLYDPGAVTNEDAELNQRILAAGGKIYLSREIVAYYYPRKTHRELVRQYFRYGQGRARTLLKHRRLVKLRPFLPFFALTGGAAMLVLAPRSVVTWSAFGAYGLLALVEAERTVRRHPDARRSTVLSIFPVMHVSHGLGVATGLVRYALGPDWEPAERLSPRAPEPSRT
jgi:succinoglycan biosynthesis protein ExoA